MENFLNPRPDVIWVEQVPGAIIALHRFARLKKASAYAGIGNRFVEFDLDNPDLSHLREKHNTFHDVEKVFLIYENERIFL